MFELCSLMRNLQSSYIWHIRAHAEYAPSQTNEWTPREARIVASAPDYVPPPPEALNGGSLPGLRGESGQWAVSQGDD